MKKRIMNNEQGISNTEQETRNSEIITSKFIIPCSLFEILLKSQSKVQTPLKKKCPPRRAPYFIKPI